MISKDLLEILGCPISKSKLIYEEKENVLICNDCGLKYIIENDIPIMLPDKAIKF
jgi:uncharacterized protein YbaR (Trm112 family)